jgi:hypothetical protein
MCDGVQFDRRKKYRTQYSVMVLLKHKIKNVEYRYMYPYWNLA